MKKKKEEEEEETKRQDWEDNNNNNSYLACSLSDTDLFQTPKAGAHEGHGVLMDLRDVEGGQPLVDELDDGAPRDGADAHHVGETFQIRVAQVLLGVLDVVSHQPTLKETGGTTGQCTA